MSVDRDPSDNAVIEFIRPKTVPEGLIALGTVSHVSEILMKVQITGGITCLVDRTRICTTYTRLLEDYSRSQEGKCPPTLDAMFVRGQQLVCKIIEKRARKGYAAAQDIIATIDPASIQEDNIPKTLFSIPFVPMQCAVVSVEDHGYQMDVGFKGLTGFLSFDEAKSNQTQHKNSNKLIAGQVVICYLRQVVSDDGTRILQLTMSDEAKQKSVFSTEKCTNHFLNEKCISPGSCGFLTVMKVRKDGLVVNFLNEFAGFVGPHHLQDDWKNPKKSYKISDQLTCTVLYYNITTKTFALSIKQPQKFEKTLDELLKKYHTGQIIKKAEVTHLGGLKSVNFKIDGKFRGVSNVKDALDEDIGTMTKDELSVALDSSYPDGSKHKCRIKSINFPDLTIVVSLRQDFLSMQYVSVDELRPGEFLEGIVNKHVKDGLVVSFGLNLRAIILAIDLKNYLTRKSYQNYPIGKPIKCRILKVDRYKQPPKVYLTNKDAIMSDQITVIDSYSPEFKGKQTNAKILNVKSNGLIVEVFNNIKGFVPKRFQKSVEPQVGDVISCVVYQADARRRRLMLGETSYTDIVKLKKQTKKTRKENKELHKIRVTERLVIAKNKKTVRAPLKATEPVHVKTTDDDSDRILCDIVEDETDDSDSSSTSEKSNNSEDGETIKTIKSRRQRSEDAKKREQSIRQVEKDLSDSARQPQTIADFQRLTLKDPNNGDIWKRYSQLFLDNVETDKARIVCRQALKTINFRLEKEKFKVWLHLIHIEAKFGGTDRLRDTIEEASQTNDKMKLYRSCAQLLINCQEFEEAERLYMLMLKPNNSHVDMWIDYIEFLMQHRKTFDEARIAYEKAFKALLNSEQVYFKSKMAQFEFKFGQVERGKTMFENLMADNPKRVDLWRVYEAMIKKYGTRQIDNEDIRQRNGQILESIRDNIALVSKKTK